MSVVINEFRLAQVIGPNGKVARRTAPSAEKVRLACIEEAERVMHRTGLPGEEFVGEVNVRVGPRGGVYFEIATRLDHGPRTSHSGQSLQEYMNEKADREGENSWLFKGLKRVFPGVRRDRTRIVT